MGFVRNGTKLSALWDFVATTSMDVVKGRVGSVLKRYDRLRLATNQDVFVNTLEWGECLASRRKAETQDTVRSRSR
jgi:hypothetical protein